MRRPWLPTAAIAAATLTACDTTYYVEPPCVPTRLTARDARKISVREARKSAVVVARLSRGRQGVPGKEVTFTLLNDDGSTLASRSGVTGTDGRASVDFKSLDPRVIVAVVRADDFRASFAGDEDFCGSAGDAAFRTLPK